eukprot:TRINITY_DN5505_c0_g1_i1.p1 TRINITY_DN5505_c0_g1~~TRINITY_DN5505_c0_g1_i1.p1  ORF type:complete len:238 (+),score=58.43 TRINITY_DN5505_c0_g1_i1:322-1035(+)
MGCGASGVSEAEKCDEGVIAAPKRESRRSTAVFHAGKSAGVQHDNPPAKHSIHRHNHSRNSDHAANDLKEKLDMLVARLVFEEEQAMLFNSYSNHRPSSFGRSAQQCKHDVCPLSLQEINANTSVLTIETPHECASDDEGPDNSCAHPRRDSWAAKLLKQECAMCLEEFTCGDQLRILFCSHAFHKHCIDEWFSRSRTCPFCLQDVTCIPKPDDLPECDLPTSPFQAPLQVFDNEVA